MSAALWSGYAVVQLKFGDTPERSSPKWVGDTPAKAIANYDMASTTHNYRWQSEHGYARVESVQLVESDNVTSDHDVAVGALLVDFALAVLRQWHGDGERGDIDGGTLQALAVKTGVCREALSVNPMIWHLLADTTRP